MYVARSDFCQWRTPPGLAEYVESLYQEICYGREAVVHARQRREPYKSYVEELLPFSIYCSHRFGSRTDVRCALAPRNLPYDALIETEEHRIVVQVTWPRDGAYEATQARLLNERGFGETLHWDSRDVSLQEAVLERIKETASKKLLHDHRSSDGSALLFVVDDWLFWQSDPGHRRVLLEMEECLRSYDFKVEEVSLLLMRSKEVKVLTNNGH